MKFENVVMLDVTSVDAPNVVSSESLEKRLSYTNEFFPQILIDLYKLDESMICLEIQDNGVGLAQESLKKIFEIGFSTKSGYSGFGLHDCANFVRSYHGEISVDSKGIDQGFSLKMRFPILQSET